MANNVMTRKVTIMLDKERNLIVDLNTFAELEEIYGDNQTAINALKSGSFKAIRKFLWLCLVHEDPTLTEQQTGSLITAGNMEEFAEIIMASVDSMSKKK